MGGRQMRKAEGRLSFRMSTRKRVSRGRTSFLRRLFGKGRLRWTVARGLGHHLAIVFDSEQVQAQ
jgi:hypothetical protein